MPTQGQAPAREKQANADVSADSLSGARQMQESSSHASFYGDQMAKHGVFYWLLHAIVAFGVAVAGAAVWDSFLSKLF
ncbi:MAG TPA: hypothetical protein VI685_25865 [Candidatus Angelobacter sp.]